MILPHQVKLAAKHARASVVESPLYDDATAPWQRDRNMDQEMGLNHEYGGCMRERRGLKRKRGLMKGIMTWPSNA
jgi:hypothetical protein